MPIAPKSGRELVEDAMARGRERQALRVLREIGYPTRSTWTTRPPGDPAFEVGDRVAVGAKGVLGSIVGEGDTFHGKRRWWLRLDGHPVEGSRSLRFEYSLSHLPIVEPEPEPALKVGNPIHTDCPWCGTEWTATPDTVFRCGCGLGWDGTSWSEPAMAGDGDPEFNAGDRVMLHPDVMKSTLVGTVVGRRLDLAGSYAVCWDGEILGTHSAAGLVHAPDAPPEYVERIVRDVYGNPSEVAARNERRRELEAELREEPEQPPADPPVRWARDVPGEPARILTSPLELAPLVDEHAWSTAALLGWERPAECPSVEAEPEGVRECVLVGALMPGRCEHGWVAYGQGVEAEHPLRDDAITAWRKALAKKGST